MTSKLFKIVRNWIEAISIWCRNLNFSWLRRVSLVRYPRPRAILYLFVYAFFLLVLDFYFMQFWVRSSSTNTIYYSYSFNLDDFFTFIIIITIGFGILKCIKIFNFNGSVNTDENIIRNVDGSTRNIISSIFKTLMFIFVVLYTIFTFCFWVIYFLVLIFGTGGKYWDNLGLTFDPKQSLNNRINRMYRCRKPQKIPYVGMWKKVPIKPRHRGLKKYFRKRNRRNLLIYLRNSARKCQWYITVAANIFFDITKRIIFNANFTCYNFFHGFTLFNSIIFFIVISIHVNFFIWVFEFFAKEVFVLVAIEPIITVDNNSSTVACDSEMDNATIILNSDVFDEKKVFVTIKSGINVSRELFTRDSNFPKFGENRFYCGPKFFYKLHDSNDVFIKTNFISPWQFNFANYNLLFLSNNENSFFGLGGYPRVYFLQALLQLHVIKRVFAKSKLKRLIAGFNYNAAMEMSFSEKNEKIFSGTYMNYGVRLLSRLGSSRKHRFIIPENVLALKEIFNIDIQSSTYYQYDAWLRFHELLFANYDFILLLGWRYTKLSFVESAPRLLIAFLHGYQGISFLTYPIIKFSRYGKPHWFINNNYFSFDYKLLLGFNSKNFAFAGYLLMFSGWCQSYYLFMDHFGIFRIANTFCGRIISIFISPLFTKIVPHRFTIAKCLDRIEKYYSIFGRYPNNYLVTYLNWPFYDRWARKFMFYLSFKTYKSKTNVSLWRVILKINKSKTKYAKKLF